MAMRISEWIAMETPDVGNNPFDEFTRRLNAITDADEYASVNVDYRTQVSFIRSANSGN